MNTHGEALKSIQREVEEIETTIFELIYSHCMYRKFRSSVNANSEKNTGSDIGLWIYEMFCCHIAVTIRKLLDRSDNVHSLCHLLKKIRRNHIIFSKDLFIKKFLDAKIRLKYAERAWIGIAGSIEANCLPYYIIDNDMTDLADITRDIITLTDKAIVHHERNVRDKLKSIPDDKDIEAAVTSILKVYKRYYLLINLIEFDHRVEIDENTDEIFSRIWA